MTCLEVQSKIIAYIDNHLERDEKQDFLCHIKNCDNCKDELNICYTMIEGMRQLDEHMPLARDFTEELNNRIDREMKSNKKKREFLRSSVGIVVVGLLSFLIFGYVNFLNLLHEQEQTALKQKQGDYYYSKTFDEILFSPDEEELVRNINILSEEPEPGFYKRVRQYNIISK